MSGRGRVIDHGFTRMNPDLSVRGEGSSSPGLKGLWERLPRVGPSTREPFAELFGLRRCGELAPRGAIRVTHPLRGYPVSIRGQSHVRASAATHTRGPL